MLASTQALVERAIPTPTPTTYVRPDPVQFLRVFPHSVDYWCKNDVGTLTAEYQSSAWEPITHVVVTATLLDSDNNSIVTSDEDRSAYNWEVEHSNGLVGSLRGYPLRFEDLRDPGCRAKFFNFSFRAKWAH